MKKTDSNLMNITMKSLIKSTNDFIFVKNKDFIYEGASDAFVLECVGLSNPDEIIGKSDFDIFKDKELAKKYRADDEKIFESKVPMFEYQEEYPDKDGRKRYCLSTKHIILDEDGNPAGILGQCRDITEQVELELTGKEQSFRLERQQNIFEALQNVYNNIMFLDLKNDSYYHLTGGEITEKYIDYSGKLSQIIDVWIMQEIEPSIREECREFCELDTLSDRLSREKILIKEVHTKSAGWQRVSLIPLSYDSDGSIVNCLWVGQSIEAAKRKELEQHEALKGAYEAAKRANNAKTEFLSRVSHDIRTPMNAIIGMTNIAELYIDDKERVKDCLSKITYSSRHLLNLINEVLDMSKIESGNIEINEEEFNIKELINNIIDMVNPLINEKKHNLEVNYHELRHERVIGDRLHIQQIFMNILSNAIKYTCDGGQIKLDIREFENCKPLVTSYEFVFEDNGLGMSKEYLSHIYEPFSREEDSRTNKILGTGLGMSIVINLIKMLGGEIKVESEKGVGSKFSVALCLKIGNTQNLPLIDDFKSTQTPVSTIDEISVANKFSGCRILVVEDQEFNREIAKVFLEMTGAVVCEAENGLQAVNMVEKSPENYYDMIFMDIQMPIMNGYEATRTIRKLLRNDVSSLPIIAMTANAFIEDVNEAMMAGMNEHISKPVDLSKFIDVLTRRIKI